MTTAIEMPTPINFSDNAVKKVKELIEEEGTPELKLRVFVSGGGCSGMQYGFTFEESINEDDTKVEKDNVMLLIDPMSLQYLLALRLIIRITYKDRSLLLKILMQPQLADVALHSRRNYLISLFVLPL